MTKRRWNLFVNTTSLFLSSYLGIKLLLLLGKLVIAYLFNIEIFISAFSLFTNSPAESPVWTYNSVLTFFSVELVLLLSIIVFFVFTKYFKKSNSEAKQVVYINILSATLLITFSSIVAGIISKSNVFYFFNWLHISYSVMILGVMVCFILGVGVMAWFSKQYLILSSKISENSMVLKGYKHYVYPLLIGLLLIYLPYITFLNKFIQIEFFMSALFVSSAVLVKVLKRRQILDILSEKVNYVYVFIAASLFCLFIILNFF